MFTGYSTDSVKFLEELRLNNNRIWFKSNQHRYEESVRGPSLDLIRDFQKELDKISLNFVAVPKKVGGSLMRIHRDVRFSKNKSPYKNNIGIHFRHKLGKDIHAPGFYLHISPENCHLGSGIWRPDSKTLKKIRSFIADNPNAWKETVSKFKGKNEISEWRLVGGSLKRSPLGFEKDHPAIEDLKRIDFLLKKKIKIEQIMERDFLVFLGQVFAYTSEFVEYLCLAINIEF